jgi:hypothetical protein
MNIKQIKKLNDETNTAVSKLEKRLIVTIKLLIGDLLVH